MAHSDQNHPSSKHHTDPKPYTEQYNPDWKYGLKVGKNEDHQIAASSSAKLVHWTNSGVTLALSADSNLRYASFNLISTQ